MKFVDELATRLNAKEYYRTCCLGKQSVKQLSLVSLNDLKPHSKPSTEDEREAALTRQATRIALLNQEADLSVLQKHGWTKEDAISLAQTLSQRRDFGRAD